MKKNFTFIVLFALMFISCTKRHLTGTIKGIVTLDGVPVANVRINVFEKFISGADDLHAYTYTNSKGEYEFKINEKVKRSNFTYYFIDLQPGTDYKYCFNSLISADEVDGNSVIRNIDLEHAAHLRVYVKNTNPYNNNDQVAVSVDNQCSFDVYTSNTLINAIGFNVDSFSPFVLVRPFTVARLNIIIVRNGLGSYFNKEVYVDTLKTDTILY